MSDLEIHQFPCLSDNYGVLIHDADAGVTAAIDAPDANAVRRALGETGWTLTHILVTHKHHDHVGGVAELKRETGCVVFGPKAEAGSVPGLDTALSEGDAVSFGNFEAQVLETPGHTSGHISYFLPAAKVAFVGDTVFAMGCGRLFEGDAKTMWASLQKIMALPGDTQLYCGHEYTAANARFALTVEPGNEDLQARAKEVERLRADGKPTLPTVLDVELGTNPFMRPMSTEIRESVGLPDAPDYQVFGAVRAAKDRA